MSNTKCIAKRTTVRLAQVKKGSIGNELIFKNLYELQTVKK